MVGRVLVVENTIPFAKKVCATLRNHGIDAMSTLDFKELQKAGEDDDLYEEFILKMVESALKERPFDVIIINLHLKEEGDHLLGEGDFLGGSVLEHIKEKYPGISSVVFTAHPPEEIYGFFNRYNLANVIRKSGAGKELKIDKLCETVENVILYGHPVIRVINGKKYELKGVNSQMYRQLHNKGVMSKIFSGINDYDNRLIKALGSDLRAECVAESANLMTDLWHLEPGIPRYPLIYKLGKMEFGRAFWDGHRDHIVHQLLVYLLGLYLYYGNERLQHAISSNLSEDEFLRAWKIAALFHDVGYVFETAYIEKGKISKDVCDELNELRKNSLHHYFEARDISVLKSENRNIRLRGEIFIAEVEQTEIDTITYFGSTNLFSVLEPQAKKTNLSDSENSLENYFNYAIQTRPKKQGQKEQDRNPYVDHGIAGALVLLQQYKSLQYFVEKTQLVIDKYPKLVTQATTKLIKELTVQIAECQKIVEMAASAIALHYINVTDWDHDDAFNKAELTLNHYNLSLADTPFEFLLALVDALQSWDRPRYSMPKKDEYVTQAQDVAINLGEDKIIITYKNDKYQNTPKAKFVEVLESMSNYLSTKDLETILKKGPALLDNNKNSS